MSGVEVRTAESHTIHRVCQLSLVFQHGTHASSSWLLFIHGYSFVLTLNFTGVYVSLQKPVHLVVTAAPVHTRGRMQRGHYISVYIYLILVFALHGTSYLLNFDRNTNQRKTKIDPINAVPPGRTVAFCGAADRMTKERKKSTSACCFVSTTLANLRVGSKVGIISPSGMNR